MRVHPPTVPGSTYRLQFSARFRFTDALEIVPYLDALGVGHVYASPYFRARPGSDHGYDVIDPNTLNPEVGTADEHRAFVDALQARGIGQILDIVPNHMGIGGTENPWWQDVLEWGERSPYANFFDIDWRPAKEELRGKVLLPLLGDHFGTVLERGELALSFERTAGSFAIAYYDRRFPLAPWTYAPVLDAAAGAVDGREPVAGELRALGLRFADLAAVPPETGREPQRARAVALSQRLAELARSDAVAAAIETVLNLWRVERGAEAADRLDELIRTQNYRLAYWRVAGDEINYRRFFDVNDLAGVRVEDAEVLGRTHRLIFEMIGDGRIQGVRVDHIDGLSEPAGYCNLLHDRAVALGHPQYLVVEKILARFEALPRDWQVDGTTGYDFAAAVNGLFVDPRAEFSFDRIYREFAGMVEEFDEVAAASKGVIMATRLASELTVLATALDR
ncbi:MAG: alpha-amylase family glycosyl hydrolase, partial [Vulcanimicrobiaceae bacterium]